mgnify:FL=1
MKLFQSRRQPADAKDDALTRQDVIDGFRWILGREPESEETINAHLGLGTVAELRRVLLASKEFSNTNKFFRFAEKWILCPVYGGQYEMWLDLHDLYVSDGCLIDNYEPLETAFIKANTPAGGRFLDIGANIGWHTLGLARIAGTQGRVYSFEPRSPTNAYLRRTIEQNGLGDVVKVHDFGLWSEDATLDLGWQQDTVNPGNSYIAHAGEGLTTQKIDLKRLDDVMDDKIDFIKIDVEGAEPKVFEGARRLIETSRPLILAELNPDQLRSVSGVTSAQFIRQMAAFGYECRVLEPGHEGKLVTDFPTEIGRELINVVFVPNGKSVTFG